MKYKIISTLIVFLFSFNQSYSQEMSDEAKNIAREGLEYSKNGEHVKACEKYEYLLENRSNEMNPVLKKMFQKVLRNEYLSITLERAKRNNPDYKDYCLKGIRLSKELGKEYDDSVLMFCFYLAAYYNHYNNRVKMNKWISRFYEIRENLDTDLSKEVINEMDSWANSWISKMKGID